MKRACHQHAKVDCATCAQRRRNGSTRSWRTLREQILDRDAYACRIGLPGCTIVADTVDHVLAVTHGGTDHPSNLRAACTHCNASRGAGTHA